MDDIAESTFVPDISHLIEVADDEAESCIFGSFACQRGSVRIDGRSAGQKIFYQCSSRSPLTIGKLQSRLIRYDCYTSGAGDA